MPVRPQLEYRLLWRRQGDKRERRKTFAQPAHLYRHLMRLGTQTPWKGATKRTLRGATYALHKGANIPFEEALALPIREVLLGLTRSHRPILYLRVEMRQVLEWTMVGDPLKVLRPKSFDKWEHSQEAFCDVLDADRSQRWTPKEPKAE